MTALSPTAAAPAPGADAPKTDAPKVYGKKWFAQAKKLAAGKKVVCVVVWRQTSFVGTLEEAQHKFWGHDDAVMECFECRGSSPCDLLQTEHKIRSWLKSKNADLPKPSKEVELSSIPPHVLLSFTLTVFLLCAAPHALMSFC